MHAKDGLIPCQTYLCSIIFIVLDNMTQIMKLIFSTSFPMESPERQKITFFVSLWFVLQSIIIGHKGTKTQKTGSIPV